MFTRLRRRFSKRQDYRPPADLSPSSLFVQTADRPPIRAWNTNDPYAIAGTILIMAGAEAADKAADEEFTVYLKAVQKAGAPFDENAWLTLVETSGYVELIDTMQLPSDDGSLQSVYTFRPKEPLPESF